jgi:hypothetical protein
MCFINQEMILLENYYILIKRACLPFEVDVIRIENVFTFFPERYQMIFSDIII